MMQTTGEKCTFRKKGICVCHRNTLFKKAMWCS